MTLARAILHAKLSKAAAHRHREARFGSFVNGATSDPDDAALVMAIITLAAHNLRLKVIAEGVETEEHLRFLRLLRCDGWPGISVWQAHARRYLFLHLCVTRGW